MEALLHTLQKDSFTSQISVRLDWVLDWSFVCHDIGMGVRVKKFWTAEV